MKSLPLTPCSLTKPVPGGLLPCITRSFGLCFVLLAAPVFAQTNQATPPPETPRIAEASQEAANAMQVFQLPDGVVASVFAAEPDVANPVAIDVDFQNRVWVCESFRQENGIEDNRNHPEWLMDDLAAQTVADRLAYIKKHLGDQAVAYTKQDDRIRLLVDSNGDGVADQSTVFADRFNSIEEGTGAGILAWQGGVFYTCIPKLWNLQDSSGDGVADTRHAMHDGFGVRFAFRGHDMHGLIIGPDGRLYFSIGDRGYHVNDSISDPASGAVFRCELDGSDLEVIHRGLRNPQELAFDDYGNLFTGDNNSDSGDKARMVYVVEGGDTGWRMHYQYLPDRGPFNREKIWHPAGGPAYVLPPIDNFADGPSGFAFYPGTGFSDHMKGRFLLCDFRGQTSGSGIKTFRLKPKGAFFEIADEENTFWNILATDCCFGPDGRLYVSDWVHGWNGLGKGRIYAFEDQNANETDTGALLAAKWAEYSMPRLKELLGHEDRRVRMEAQFELVHRGATVELSQGVIFADDSPSQLARIHALWAIDQLCRTTSVSTDTHELLANTLLALTADKDPELRAQAARLGGDYFQRTQQPLSDSFARSLAKLIEDENPRVQYFAAMSLGKIGDADSVASVLNFQASSDIEDPMLRHAGIMALLNHSIEHGDGLLSKAVHHASEHVRLAAVVACRKLVEQGHPFGSTLIIALNDRQANVSLEAARAIHDLPVEKLPANALSALASLRFGKGAADSSNDHLVRRVINANFRLGDQDSLVRVREFAGNNDFSSDRRADAIEMLKEWNQPPKLDKVLGEYRPLPLESRAKDSAKQIATLFTDHFDEMPVELGTLLIDAAAHLNVTSVRPVLKRVLANDSDADRRLKAFQGLLELGGEDLQALATAALTGNDSPIRMEAIRYLAKENYPAVKDQLLDAIKNGSTAERQNAVAVIGESDDPEARQQLELLLSEFEEINDDAKLDVLLAAESHESDELRAKQVDLEKKLVEADANFKRKLTMTGGDADLGSKIFYERGDVSCLRCHKIQGSGGDVGPNLSDIGLKRDRAYLLESLVEPNKTITENFETVVVLDVDGKIHVGVTKSSTDEVLSIMNADAIMINIPQADIEEIRRGDSAMPDDVMKHLTLKEMRDLIEFLATRKEADATIKQ